MASTQQPRIAVTMTRRLTEQQPNPQGRTRWVPGEIGIWAFVFTDLIIFSFYFATFFHERSREHAVFAHDNGVLNTVDGVINCVFLLTASLFVALAVQGVNEGKGRLARKLLLGAAVCGVAFILHKPFEWIALLANGYGPHHDIFFQLYYMLTGLHLVHVLIAMIVLKYLWGLAAHVRHVPSPRQSRFLENGATYWHLVDILWLVLFAIFYLMR
jgi:nitric oxide reductase NorE protein